MVDGTRVAGCPATACTTAEVVETLDRAIAASEALRGEMLLREDQLRRARVAVAAGTPVLDALEDEGHYVLERRHQGTDAFDDMIQLRHDVRLAALTCGLDQGLTMTELAHRMGVSRQRISQLVRSRVATHARGGAGMEPVAIPSV